MDKTNYTDAFALKSALEELLGVQELQRLKDSRGLSVWKVSLRKALKASSLAIKSTVQVSDAEFQGDLLHIVENGHQGVANAKTILDAVAAFSACYMRLSFMQLGQMPNRKGSPHKTLLRSSNWQLNAYRSVQYVQSERQKLFVEFRNDSRPLSEKAIDVKYQALRKKRESNITLPVSLPLLTPQPFPQNAIRPFGP